MKLFFKEHRAVNWKILYEVGRNSGALSQFEIAVVNSLIDMTFICLSVEHNVELMVLFALWRCRERN